MTTAMRDVPRTGNRDERQGAAIVVGASLAGLMTALALSHAGVDVTMLERSGAAPRARKGAALGGVSAGLLSRITGSRHSQGGSAPLSSVAPGVQSWMAVHARLRAAVDADPYIELRPHTIVRSVDQDADSAWVITSEQQTFRGDVVIGADGHGSVVRLGVAPDKPDATFAGYLIWLGLTNESSLASSRRLPRDVDILSGGQDCLLGYPLPGPDGSVAPGSRQVGWAWYDASHNDLLRETGSVVGNVVRRSLTSADIPEVTFRELADKAKDLWPSPWREAILDCIERRAVIGTPIAEYVPDKLVNGRLALVGDAAHVPTPMTGSGFSASLHDAEAVAEAVAVGVRESTVAQALTGYERKRLGNVRGMVQAGQHFSRSFTGRAA
ncbi:FAD-dependent monooxygenase [Streptomyces caniscabiei]|uniref:FAD-dependent monooxygenase n=1 Tax=Streptomyces caniscabiei TaxID=2746961 RepID=UPI0029BF17FD|nr:FAD-dependent monooxygenase [Streptomyces caniscabiei]MDX2740713.1 FAD-dependent monooxygenase [Streptomyces caniscabiei]MDX2776943.1 FAD-dependent monooxygenase [Streptomyces caniscabiei]